MSHKLLAASTLAAAMTGLPSAAPQAQTLLSRQQASLDLPAFSLGDEEACGRVGDAFVVHVTQGSLTKKGNIDEFAGTFEIPPQCAVALAYELSGGTAKHVVFDLNGPAEENIDIPVFEKDGGTTGTFQATSPSIIAADNLKLQQVVSISNAGAFALKMK